MLLPLFSVVLLAGIWSIYWFLALHAARDAFESERERFAKLGITLSCNQENWAGYPFRFEFDCVSPLLRLRDRMEAKASYLQLVALAYNPRQIVVLLDGPTRLAADGILPVVAAHQRAIASITMQATGEASVSIDLPGLAIPDLMSADRMMFHSRPAEDGKTDIAASVDGLNYQPSGRPPLLIDRGDLIGLLSSKARTLAITKLELRQGQVRYWGSGAIALDPAQRISGKLATETNNLDGLLALTLPHLQISDQQKASLRSVLGLLGNVAKADVLARDGELFIGPFKAADLKPLF